MCYTILVCRATAAQASTSAIPVASDAQPSASISGTPGTAEAIEQGSSSASASAIEQGTAGVDRRGRQKISWQPPTQAQRDAAIQVSQPLLASSLLCILPLAA